jgi:hypothetical protein
MLDMTFGYINNEFSEVEREIPYLGKYIYPAAPTE